MTGTRRVALFASWLERSDAPTAEMVAEAIKSSVRRFGIQGCVTRMAQDIDLDVDAGAMVGVMGPSGSGKSTLLTIAARLEDPTSGEVRVYGEQLAKLSRNAKARLRRRSVGFVFQDFNLLPGLTAAENIAAARAGRRHGPQGARGSPAGPRVLGSGRPGIGLPR